MEGWAQGSVGDSTSLGFLSGSPEFGVFLGEVKNAVFRLQGPVQTGIAQKGSGSERRDNPTKAKDLGLGHVRPALWAPGAAPEGP